MSTLRGPFGRAWRSAEGLPSPLQHGASVQITALNGVPLSGMGTKAVSAPSWHDMQADPLDQAFGTPSLEGGGWPNWNTEVTGGLAYSSSNNVDYLREPYIVNTRTRGGPHCTQSLYQRYGWITCPDGVVRTQYGQYVRLRELPDSRTWYVSFYRLMDVPPGSDVLENDADHGGVPTGSRNWKPLGMFAYSAVDGTDYMQWRHDLYPCNGTGHFYYDFRGVSYTVMPNGYNAQYPPIVAGVMTQGVWQRHEYLVDIGTVGNHDWHAQWWIDGVLQVDFKFADDPPTDNWSGTLLYDDHFRVIDINKYLAQELGDTPTFTKKDLPIEFWLDDLYADCTAARVEVGNAATWAACTHREIQPWTAWADGSVTVTVNHGTLPHGTQYLYAIKPDGTPFDTNGHPVVLA
jgi:hypothetical protein